MKKLSKFDSCEFFDDWGNRRMFAISKQKYSYQEAKKLFVESVDYQSIKAIVIAGVVWQARINADGERCVGWWLDLNKTGQEPRYCPVWVFVY